MTKKISCVIDDHGLVLQLSNLFWSSEGSIPPRNAACRDVLLGILFFKRLTARRLYKSFGVKGLAFILTAATSRHVN
jgi:hypothetical protein